VKVAALFVQKNGVYFGLPDVDPWDEQRDARLYKGPWPVVAHPPCARWCRLAGLVEARWGYRRGDDGGCFVAALAVVRKWGGVLEHPAYSDAWAAHDLNAPPTGGGWVNADFLGGWTCYVEQHRYGHQAKKATWLYASGVELPPMRWGLLPDRDEPPVWLSWCGNHTRRRGVVERLSAKARNGTPPEFRDVLLAMTRTVSPVRYRQTGIVFPVT
jgi:hypothetical protein